MSQLTPGLGKLMGP